MDTEALVPDIVSQDCFLRKLPAGLSLVQRMKFDAIRLAAEMVGLANFRLMKTALHICCEEELRPSGRSRTALLLDAWSIIMHCHTIREILRSLEFNTVEISAFLAATELVSEVRDAQQHYHDQFPNRAKKKRKTVPLYGALAWTYSKEAPPPASLYLITCCYGASLEPKTVVKVPNPAGQKIRLPIGNLRLQAFDHDIDLQNVTDEVSSLVCHFNTRVAALIRQELDQVADEKKIDRARLHANPVADPFFALCVQLKNKGPA